VKVQIIMKYPTFLNSVLAAAAAMTLSCAAHAADTDRQLEAGKKLYSSANCVGCHKWSGIGGGGYGGAAASLRESKLNRDNMIMTVNCGRPGTGMPYFDTDAYSDGRCYGMTHDKLPPESKVIAANRFLNKREVELVVDYVQAKIVGQGSPTFEQCRAFYGADTRACDVFPKTSDPAASGATNGTGR
jgi:hypothetical protein